MGSSVFELTRWLARLGDRFPLWTLYSISPMDLILHLPYEHYTPSFKENLPPNLTPLVVSPPVSIRPPPFFVMERGWPQDPPAAGPKPKDDPEEGWAARAQMTTCNFAALPLSLVYNLYTMARVQDITVWIGKTYFFRVAEEETLLTNRKCIPIIDGLSLWQTSS